MPSITQSNPSLAITKYQFSGLLNEAWSKTMNPATICSGFRKCGVYPFNPNAIDCSVSVINPEASLQQVNTVSTSDHTNSGEIQQQRLSPETMSLYQRRLENGYDLPDEQYMEWLKVHHPEMFADLYNRNGEIDVVSLTHAFCDVPVASPVALGDPELSADEIENNREAGAMDRTENDGERRATPSQAETENSVREGEIRATLSAENNGEEGEIRAMLLAENNGEEGEIRATPSSDEIENNSGEHQLRDAIATNRTESSVVTGDQSHNQLRYISKYLVQFVPDAKPQKTETNVRISGARVLTGEKCISILKEREEK